MRPVTVGIHASPAIQGVVRVGSGSPGFRPESDAMVYPAEPERVPLWPSRSEIRQPPTLLLDRLSLADAGHGSPILVGRMRAFETSMRVVQRLLEAGQLDAALDVIEGLKAGRRGPAFHSRRCAARNRTRSRTPQRRRTLAGRQGHVLGPQALRLAYHLLLSIQLGTAPSMTCLLSFSFW